MGLDAEYGYLVSAPEVLRGSRADLDGRAATALAGAIDAHLRRAPHVVLAVVGGRSVGGIYGHLQARQDLPWERMHVFLADERLVPLTSDESNFRLVQDDLLSGPLARGALPPGNAHPFPLRPDRDDMGRSDYDDALRRLGGAFDVAILSAGEDGHTASLFPNHPSIRDSSPGFVLVDHSPKPPPRRVSASRHLLETAGFGLLVFYGEGKRAALDRFLDPGLTVTQCPCKVVNSMRRALVVTDLT